MSITGLEPQDHSYLHIQGRVAGMFPCDWKTVWVSSDSADMDGAMARLGEYHTGYRKAVLFHYTSAPIDYRLIRVTVRQTVTEEELA